MVNPQIGIRLSPQDKELLEKVAAARGEGVSSFVRRAIRRELALLSFYSEAEKKALGIPTERGKSGPSRGEERSRGESG